ncbi:MAG: gluconate 2-dehydrogenase subunit 3 family protein [Gaiellaceae bacterium]
MTRLRLLKAGAVSAAGVAAGGVIAAAGEADDTPKDAPPPALKFLSKWEFELITAMADTIWPTDDLGPGARVAGVGYYIDGQLAGAWGQGHRMYLNGPFFTPADTGHGWQIPMNPSQVYRAFLPGFDQYVRTTYGNVYQSLTAAQQTQALNDIQTSKAVIPLAGSTQFRSADFFSMFRQNVLEGMLADPAYGGNKGMVGWKWIGYPGDPMRRGDSYYKYIFKPGVKYPYEHKPLPMMAAPIGAARPGGVEQQGQGFVPKKKGGK